MDAGSTTPKVWANGRLQDADSGDAALATLCQAVERAVRAHQADAVTVRAVILLIDQPGAPARAQTPEPAHTPVPVYVDVFDSGFGHDSGYGHGI